MKIELVIRQQLNLNLSPQMLLLRDLLQMDSVELEQYVQTAVSENPFLRLEPSRQVTRFAAPPQREWSERFTERDDTGDLLSRLPDPNGPDLYSVLHADADRLSCSFPEKTALHCLISCLEKNGRLEMPLETVSDLFDISLPLLHRSLALLWEMEPVGMGARSLEECLSLQMKHLYPEDTLAVSLIRQHLAELARKDFGKLARKYSVEPARIREILEHIRQLDPYPLPVPAEEEPVRYVREELTAVRTAGGFSLSLCDDLSDRLDLDPEYLILLDKVPEGPDRYWMLSKKQDAENLLSHIRTRGQLLLEVAAYLSGKQADYLLDPTSPLRPLTLTQASQDLGLHLSVLSRLINGKYLRLGARLIPLRSLFVREFMSDGKRFSASQIRAVLAEIIETEPPDSLLTDLKLCEELKKRGIVIARRTAAKYRKELGIAVLRKRKRSPNQ